MTTVAPVLVARTIGRWNSSARMREIARCWSIAIESPNQAMLLTLSSTVGASAASAEVRADLVAEQVLVADVGRDALARQTKGGCASAAAAEVAERDVHHVGEPAEHARDEFAERHQVVLLVAIGRRFARAETQHRIAVGPAVAHRQADDGRLAAAAIAAAMASR